MSYIKTTSAVRTTIVTSEDGSHTYSITKALEGAEGQKAIIVLLYPTRTAEMILGENFKHSLKLINKNRNTDRSNV